MVCVDGSEDADRALERAIALAGGRKVVCLHVVEIATTSILDPFHDKLDHIQNLHARESGQQIADKYRGMCASVRGLSYDVVVAESTNPRETILEKAREVAAGTIVIGSHGHGRLYDALVGSVSAGVIRGATCPVLVVPAREPK
jgi:nucleotide-binding universal stress UspA family protein